MSRRRFSERDVIRTLLHQGVDIQDFRTGEPITLENVGQVEREHIHEVALGGPDDPANCRYSLDASHKVVTHGNGATSAGSSRHRIAKAKPKVAAKFRVQKRPRQARPITADLVSQPSRRCSKCGESKDCCACPPRLRRSNFRRKS